MDLYTRQCSLDVTAYELAVMAATLAEGGINPITKEHVISASVCPRVLAAMTTAGMYETSGGALQARATNCASASRSNACWHSRSGFFTGGACLQPFF